MSTVLRDLHAKHGINATLDRIELAFQRIAEDVGEHKQESPGVPIRLVINDAVDRLQFMRIVTNAGYTVALEERPTLVKGRLDYIVVIYLKENL
jgi:hypothetical protein